MKAIEASCTASTVIGPLTKWAIRSSGMVGSSRSAAWLVLFLRGMTCSLATCYALNTKFLTGPHQAARRHQQSHRCQGLALVRAILDGERDPDRLLALCDIQIRRAKADRVKESLRGSWDAKHLFALRQALQSWEHYQHQITECDRQILAILPQPNDKPPPSDLANANSRKRPRHNVPEIGQFASHPGADMSRARLDYFASPYGIQRPATVLRGRHRSEPLAHRKTLHRLDRPGTGKPPERQAPWQHPTPS
ncbi:protein of unknown function (plasmid) [Cupriavidus taiwanensis]|uniref:Uncharacterized protein n=1 Tax=Cupriavidus taiwanensis TaxID=164546 RepID=A0A375IWE0_9BURK|nr:hypothetical protein CT19425_U370011 [Cupriavidus taiwanensis]SPK77732.1 protein of unknown function [Cupriavidus taiwanensis]